MSNCFQEIYLNSCSTNTTPTKTNSHQNTYRYPNNIGVYFVAVRLVGADDGHGGVGGDEDSCCKGDKERKTATEDVGITLVVDEAVLREGIVHQ